MASSSVAASVTVRAMGPAVSWKTTRGDMPARLISPGVTRTPTRLQKLAGKRIEPPVSSPMPTVARFAATAAAVPALDPPGSRSVSYGFSVLPLADECPNHDVAKSGRVVLPRMIAPASLSLATTVESVAGT
jgi:hypothetical protein